MLVSIDDHDAVTVFDLDLEPYAYVRCRFDLEIRFVLRFTFTQQITSQQHILTYNVINDFFCGLLLTTSSTKQVLDKDDSPCHR